MRRSAPRAATAIIGGRSSRRHRRGPDPAPSRSAGHPVFTGGAAVPLHFCMIEPSFTCARFFSWYLIGYSLATVRLLLLHLSHPPPSLLPPVTPSQALSPQSLTNTNTQPPYLQALGFITSRTISTPWRRLLLGTFLFFLKRKKKTIDSSLLPSLPPSLRPS